jgi:hypothetical protein
MVRSPREDTAYAHRVGDRLFEAVLLGDLKVEQGGLVHTDLDHVHDEVRPFERPPPVEMFLDFRIGYELLRSIVGHHARGL